MTATTRVGARTAGSRAAAKKRALRRRRLMWPLLASVTIVALLFIGLYPVRTFLAQRGTLNRAEHQLEVLKQQNAQLDQRVQALNTDTEIEQLARERYNLVRPGEEAYAILPSPPPPIEVPAVWPFTGLAQRLSG
jgi:cell division protein FtsB